MNADTKEILSNKLLNEITQDLPSAKIKLLAAWDALSNETQAKLLIHFRENTNHKIIEKCLKNGNSYIRYLAARNYIYFYNNVLNEMLLDNNKDKSPNLKYIDVISNDECLLVRYTVFSLREYWKYCSFTVENINQDSYEEIIMLCNQQPPLMTGFTHLTTVLIDQKKVSDEFIADYIQEYLNTSTFALAFERAPFDYSWVEEVEALWKMVPQLPLSVLKRFLKHLPAEFAEEIPESILYNIDPSLLPVILERDDVKLNDFRRHVFFNREHKYNSRCLLAAITANFYLSYDEFHDLMLSNSHSLSYLEYSNKIDIVYTKALKDYLEANNKLTLDSVLYNKWEISVRLMCKALNNKTLNMIRKLDNFQQLRELSIYQLAQKVVPWTGKDENIDLLPDSLLFLKDFIINNDTWKTFILFSNKLNYTKKYDDVLFQSLANEHYIEIRIPPKTSDELFVDTPYKEGYIEEKVDIIYQMIADEALI